MSLECPSIEVILKNEVLASKKSLQGIYEFSAYYGTASWKTNSHAIWYKPSFKYWAIGDLKDIGTMVRDITSTANRSDKTPSDVPNDEWHYHDDDVWKKPKQSGDIIVKCVNSQELLYSKGTIHIYFDSGQKSK